MRKAKIVDTIGPSTEDYDNLLKLVEAGMDVARLNRSHGTPEDHLKVLQQRAQGQRSHWSQRCRAR